MTTFTKQIGGQHDSKNSLAASLFRVCHPCAFGHYWGTVDWLGNCNGDTHENEWRGKTLDNGYCWVHYWNAAWRHWVAGSDIHHCFHYFVVRSLRSKMDMMVTDNAGMLIAEQESEIEDMLYDINQQTWVQTSVYLHCKVWL